MFQIEDAPGFSLGLETRGCAPKPHQTSNKTGVFLSKPLSFPGGSDGKTSAYNLGDPGSIPGLEKILWRRKWQPTPVFLPGKSHGQRSLASYIVHGVAESDTTKRLTL